MTTTTRRRFNLGRLMATPAALAAIGESGQNSFDFLERHARGDWGEVDDEDAQANENSLRDGSRLLSAYKTLKGERLWVITEAGDDNGVRSHTTILLPDEY